MKKKMCNKVLILAGGKGTRFHPYSYVIPKPLIPINEKPILLYLINAFKKFKFKNFFISTGYHSNLIQTYFLDGKKFNVNIRYFTEKKILGTAGPISYVKNFFKKEEYFFVINGDIFTKLNFRKMLNFAIKNNYDLVIGYINKLEKSKYGVLEIINRKLVSIKEKPNFNIDISAGIYVLKNNNVIRKLPKKFLTMPDLIKMFIKKKLKIGVYEIKEYWKGIENIENLHEVSRKNK
jgi:NDP-sugar pyrophosphorylase family protein